jgi:Helix-turn-helix domain
VKLLAALRTEISDLARTKNDEVHRIAAIARTSTAAATHDQTNPELVKQSLDRLASAVSEFEESHPRLVEVGAEVGFTCEEAAALLHVDPKTVRRAAARNDLPAIRPLANGPWIFARSDIVGTATAERVATRARERRNNQDAGLTSDQLSLDIPNTKQGDVS